MLEREHLLATLWPEKLYGPRAVRSVQKDLLHRSSASHVHTERLWAWLYVPGSCTGNVLPGLSAEKGTPLWMPREVTHARKLLCSKCL